ncbi:MAG: D-lysine 5,6-aminomutase subunit alpha [Oligoflexia bacterium]|nr:D-lysine 5,6-aminomutase subunit alpha [Oligoflexia bacterium]MBF0364613.1 D-lysine 5,6-aminomutase subunit alpha [Oligoflexia bacterium]
MPKIHLDQEQITRTKVLAHEVSEGIYKFVQKHSSVSVERAVLRLYGVDGVDKESTPYPNILVEKLLKQGMLSRGVSPYIAAAMLKSGRDIKTTAELVCSQKLDWIKALAELPPAEVKRKEEELSQVAVARLDRTREVKRAKEARLKVPNSPWKYLIVATGNIYEDRTQAKAAVMAGADIIAVIRTTAQSLLDYVPYGATTEGFGGTFATQENFKIMRAALDEVMEKEKRYVRLVNYSSGLCMAEIAACAAMEDLDMLLNDSMYGILFRDINPKRTFIDQYFSRLICSRAKIIINTGEDNYLTTADAIEAAYTVTASDLINEAMAKRALLTEDLLGLGHAFEINPSVEDALLYELAHAQLARELFPHSPLKYMPPTKYKSTDIFFSHAMDTMFNFTSVTTNQGIHLAGILTEAIHTPLMQDRYKALSSINYVFNIARHLGEEIEFKRDGFVERRARSVLSQVEEFLGRVREMGLMEAIAQGAFADVKRPILGGKGLEGVFEKDTRYSNPIMDIIERDGVIS